MSGECAGILKDMALSEVEYNEYVKVARRLLWVAQGISLITIREVERRRNVGE